jgi:predicted nucleic acid-binding protein
MAVVKLVLDANVLSSDFYLAGPSFTVIANEIADGDLEVVVPEVAVIETIGNFRRSIADAHEALKRFEGKWNRLLPESSKLDQFDTYLDDLAAAYEDTLREKLKMLGAHVQPIPKVDHELLVQRAADRRRPCDSNGNGYRDSLVWETILEVAQEGDDIVFVTSDTDFTLEAEGERSLHPDLLADLEAADVEAEVTIVADLHTAIRQYLVHGEAEIGDLAQQVRLELLNDWLQDAALYEAALQAKVDPEASGLLRSTTGAEIEYVEDVSDVTDYSLLRKLGDSVLIEFEVEATAGVEMWVDEWDADDFAEARVRERGRLGQARVFLVKPLVFDCLATLDSFGRPEALEITQVHAVEGDDGLYAWDPDVCGCINPR